jgi:hypothetical protein
LRLRDGPNYIVPQEYLNNLVVDDLGNIHFPIYWIDGTQVGWNSRAVSQKMWSQSIQEDVAPRFSSWTPKIAEIIYTHRRICLCEGPFDALALAPIMPWTISTNTARVQQEILDWCKMWGLHVFLALDFDQRDAKTGRETGQESRDKISAEIRNSTGCRVTSLEWATLAPPMAGSYMGIGAHLKDPASAYAVRGQNFHTEIMLQVRQVCPV